MKDGRAVKSIRRELTGQILAGALVLLLVAGSIFFAAIYHQLVGDFDRMLDAEADVLARNSERKSSVIVWDVPEAYQTGSRETSDPAYCQLFLEDGTVAGLSKTLGVDNLPRLDGRGHAIWNARLPDGRRGRLVQKLFIEDQRRLRAHGFSPELNCIQGYLRDEEPGPVSTDVFSFHADSAPVEADTWLCTYHGPASEGLRNDEARRRVDIPETRAALLEAFGGEESDGFLEYLSEHCYDLHYAPVAQARPFSFGLGNLWRVAVDWPGSPVPPCIHRAPETRPGQPPRLLLIG